MRTMLIAILVLMYLGSARGQAGKSVDLEGDDTTSSNTDRGLDCECVPYYRCSSIRPPNNEDLVDRGAPESCASKEHVCCEKSRVIKERDVRTTTEPNTSTACGQRNPEGVGLLRITGDNDGDAQYGEFPWMVALLKQEALLENSERLEHIYMCGGSLIHPKVVLTAAHCVAGNLPEDLMIRAGEWDSSSTEEHWPHQEIRVSKVITHEGFSEELLYNDIALLILHEPVAEAEHIGFVCLPKAGQDMDQTRCFVSGWGKDVIGKEIQPILKKIELPIVPRPYCLEALRKTRLGSHFKLHKSFICAGGEAGRDACEGDGGSPLVCPLLHDPLHYQQAGIVAWGIGCGEDRTPGVYANVAHSRNWIDQKMIENNLDTTSYSY